MNRRFMITIVPIIATAMVTGQARAWTLQEANARWEIDESSGAIRSAHTSKGMDSIRPRWSGVRGLPEPADGQGCADPDDFISLGHSTM
jgi:hypothetical protein